MSFIIGLFLDHAINGQNQEPVGSSVPAVTWTQPLSTGPGSFNQLFAWHNQSIGDM